MWLLKGGSKSSSHSQPPLWPFLLASVWPPGPEDKPLCPVACWWPGHCWKNQDVGVLNSSFGERVHSRSTFISSHPSSLFLCFPPIFPEFSLSHMLSLKSLFHHYFFFNLRESKLSFSLSPSLSFSLSMNFQEDIDIIYDILEAKIRQEWMAERILSPKDRTWAFWLLWAACKASQVLEMSDFFLLVFIPFSPQITAAGVHWHQLLQHWASTRGWHRSLSLLLPLQGGAGCPSGILPPLTMARITSSFQLVMWGTQEAGSPCSVSVTLASLIQSGCLISIIFLWILCLTV